MHRCFALSGSLVFSLFLFASRSAFSQPQTSSQTVQRDPQALALLQASAAAMAGSAPADSTANGSVTLVAGSTTDQGTIRILTKGTNETAVQVQTTGGVSWSITYSNSLASRTDGAGSKPVYLEQAASSRCLYFPYPLIAGLLTNPDAAFTYIGQETLSQASVQHIRAWDTFNSNSTLQFLAPFTLTDIWLDAVTGLPRQVSFASRSGGGSAPRIAVTIVYANYQNSGGVLYPFQIQV